MIRRLGISFAVVVALGFGAVSVPAHAASVPASPALHKGSQDGYVWGLQNRLLQLGLYHSRVDGHFGVNTDQAVRAFQKQKGLPINGIVGEKTWRVLRSQTFTSDDIQLLAQVVHAEAQGESLKGQVAVAAVLLNRIHSDKFPNTVKGVIYEPHAFSSVQEGTFYDSPNGESYRAVYLATRGWDPTGDALYFFNPSKTTSSWIWSRPQTVQIGHHIFAK